ncbi:MAG: amidohydrolase, partial [Chitinophagaceae bacterium]
DFILSKDFAEGIKTLKKYNYTYDLLCYHNQLPDIIKLVDKVPDQLYVLDHCGKPDVKSQDLKTWSKNIKTLAENPNVYCKLSALLVEADWKNWKEIEIFNCFDVIFEHFGTNRLMYGSDWPVVLLSRPYADWFNLVSKYSSGFSIQDRENLFLNTASLFYKLENRDLL